jgi:predicted nucleotidyltransferase
MVKCPIQEIARKAGDAGIPFLVIGGYAVMAHGYVRTTEDLDLIAQHERRPELRKLLDDLGMKVTNDAPTFLQFEPQNDLGMKVDLMFVATNVFSLMQQASVEAKIEGIHVRVVSLLHLIALKCHALRHSKSIRRLKDMDDLLQLILIHKLDLNAPEVQATILKHGNTETYEKLRQACSDQ